MKETNVKVPTATPGAAPSAPPRESEEVAAASKSQKQRERYDDLLEAGRIFSQDIGNATDALKVALEHDREGDAKRALDRLHERYKTGYDLLAKHIKELPVLNP